MCFKRILCNSDLVEFCTFISSKKVQSNVFRLGSKYDTLQVIVIGLYEWLFKACLSVNSMYHLINELS